MCFSGVDLWMSAWAKTLCQILGGGEDIPQRAWKLALPNWIKLVGGGGWEHFHIAWRLFALQSILQRALFNIPFRKLHYEILWT